MATETITFGGTLLIKGKLHIERWIQNGAGARQVYKDLDALRLKCVSLSTGPLSFDEAGPGEIDPEDEGFYGRVYEVGFTQTLEGNQSWETDHYNAFEAFVQQAFPNDLIKGPNEGFERPEANTANPVGAPATCIFWEILYED